MLSKMGRTTMKSETSAVPANVSRSTGVRFVLRSPSANMPRTDDGAFIQGSRRRDEFGAKSVADRDSALVQREPDDSVHHRKITVWRGLRRSEPLGQQLRRQYCSQNAAERRNRPQHFSSGDKSDRHRV